MHAIHDGQCGACGHFGEHHKTDALVTILTSKKADESFLDECGHPTAFSLLVFTEQRLPWRLFLKKSRTSPHPPVQSRSENA